MKKNDEMQNALSTITRKLDTIILLLKSQRLKNIDKKEAKESELL